MATTVKTWVFASDAEGLADSGGSANIAFAWQTGDSQSGAGGCVKFTCTTKNQNTIEFARNASTGETWETWGIPSGDVVTDVQITAWYERCVANTKLKNHSLKLRIIDSNGTSVHSAGDLLDVASATLGTGTDATWQTGAAGTERAVDAGAQASTTDVRFELEYQLQTSAGGGGASVDQRFDGFELTITHETPAPSADVIGTASGTSTVSGTIKGRGDIAGTAAGTSPASAVLKGTGRIVGTAAGTSTVAGNVTDAPPVGEVAGTAAGTSTVTGTITGAGKVAGVAAGTSDATATLAPIGRVYGVAAGTSSVTGLLSGIGRIFGAATGTSDVTGTVTEAATPGAVAGTAAGTSTVTGRLTGRGAVAGSAAGTSAAEALLASMGTIAGSAAGTSLITGTLFGTANLSGTAAGTSTVSGYITDTNNPPPPPPEVIVTFDLSRGPRRFRRRNVW